MRSALTFDVFAGTSAPDLKDVDGHVGRSRAGASRSAAAGPLLAGDLDALAAVRRVFEHCAGGARILTLAWARTETADA